MEPQPALVELIAEELRQPVAAGAQVLAESIRRRHGRAVQAILFYGSCLRTGDDRNGVLDFYVLVDDYRHFYTRRIWALLNALLPPNVFYIEASGESGPVRAKYAVVSLAGLARYTSARCFHPYFWARFAQPCALVYTRNAAAAEAVANALSTAVVTFIRQGVALVPQHFRIADLWKRVLRESYHSEVRAERGETPARLYDAAPLRYERVTQAALAALPYPTSIDTVSGAPMVVVRMPALARWGACHSWRLRRAEGKLLSLLRILKGAFTFKGGVEYVLWKIERHSGVRADPSWRSRRPRLLALGSVFWRLYRKRAFR
ncbi:MAG: hypothetical protein ACE5I7_00100 [Candidatus Binatia bacterium]